MLFSVVIPTFNRRKYLPATLASVRAQRFTDVEIIVVDDGSTDGTKEYLETLQPEVRVVHQPNLGPGAARNAGVAISRGDYIAFLDSDDLWFPWTLEVIAAVVAAGSPTIVAGSFGPFWNESELAGVKEQSLDAGYFPDYLSSAAHAITAGSCAVVIARAAFLDAGGFVTASINAEDHDLILRLSDRPGFACVRQPLTVGWRRHPNSLTGDLSKTIDGIRFLISEERAGHYPGGPSRAHQRRRIITRHARPVIVTCVRQRSLGAALALYRSTFAWNLRAGHWKFLAAVPILGAWASLRRAA
jgi:glycosyltransferase involved in cell wall biosynthesis